MDQQGHGAAQFLMPGTEVVAHLQLFLAQGALIATQCPKRALHIGTSPSRFFAHFIHCSASLLHDMKAVENNLLSSSA